MPCAYPRRYATNDPRMHHECPWGFPRRAAPCARPRGFKSAYASGTSRSRRHLPRTSRRDYGFRMTTVIVATDGSDLAVQAAVAGLSLTSPPDRVIVVTAAEGLDSSLVEDATGHAAASMRP